MYLSESKCTYQSVFVNRTSERFIYFDELVWSDKDFVSKIAGSLNGSFSLGMKSCSSVLCPVPWKGWCSEQPRCCPLWSRCQSTNKPACPFIKAQSFSKDCANFNEFLLGHVFRWFLSEARGLGRKTNKKKSFLTHSLLWLLEDAHRKWKTLFIHVVPGTDQALKR